MNRSMCVLADAWIVNVKESFMEIKCMLYNVA